MNALNALVKLPHHVRLYVPSTVDVDNPASQEIVSSMVDKVVGDLSALFGGATAYDAKGGWRSGNRIVYEPVTIVESYADTLDDAAADLVVSIAQQIKATMSQEAVALEVDNALYLV